MKIGSEMMNKIILTCDESAHLIEARTEGGMGVIKTLQLKMHLSVCQACKKFSVISTWMENLLSTVGIRLQSSLELDDNELSDLQDNIKTQLKSES